MNLLTAQGAVKALRDKATLAAAYVSYEAGHDGKHRKAGEAYGYNFNGVTGNEAAGYYQKGILVLDPMGSIVKEISAWGKTTVYRYAQTFSDLDKEDEKRLLLAAFNQKGGYYQHPNPGRFYFATLVPPGFVGRVFRGGGKVYPKIAEPTNVMVIVVSAGGTNIQIVTHFPEFMDLVNGLTSLT